MRLCWVQAVFAWLQPLVDKFQAAIGGCQLEICYANSIEDVRRNPLIRRPAAEKRTL